MRSCFERRIANVMTTSFEQRMANVTMPSGVYFLHRGLYIPKENPRMKNKKQNQRHACAPFHVSHFRNMCQCSGLLGLRITSLGAAGHIPCTRVPYLEQPSHSLCSYTIMSCIDIHVLYASTCIRIGSKSKSLQVRVSCTPCEALPSKQPCLFVSKCFLL